MKDLIIILLPLGGSLLLTWLLYRWSVARAQQEYLSMLKTRADRRQRLGSWEAEMEFLKAERPNSLDKIIK
jgi:hypothetical protein